MHIYKGHEEATLDFDDMYERNWLGAFDKVPVEHPLRRAIDNDNPLIHVCLFGGGRIHWAMVPDHAKALARWHSTQRIFYGEQNGEMTGHEFLEYVEEYEKGSGYQGTIFKLGEWFS
jgi:hypothetical protein